MAFAEKFSEKIKEQEWFQQIQSSYQQLSPEQQNYVKWGGIGGGIIVFLYLTITLLSSANALKSEYFEKQALLQLINQAGDEIRRLKGQNAGISQPGAKDWKTVVQGWATAQGLQPDSIELVKETPQPAKGAVRESLLEVQVKGISLHPLVQMLYQIEHGTPPAKLKGLQIDVASDDGLLNAKLSLSGFLAVSDGKTEKK